MFTLENMIMYGSMMVILYIIYKKYQIYQNDNEYDDFYPDMDKLYDMPKLWGYACQCYDESKNNIVDGRVEVIIDVEASGLNRYELNIVKGIILINGHLYYEV